MDCESPTDGEIVAAVLAGERERFGEIVRRYYPALLRLARSRITALQVAEDVVQESFLCALKSLHTYNSVYSFRTWLWTIVLNQCRRHYSQQQRRGRVRNWSDQADPVSRDQVDERSVAPLSHLLSDERRELLNRLLFELPTVQSDALRLRFFGGLKFQEIADAMQCGLSTAKHRVRKGLARMTQALADSPLRESHHAPGEEA